MLSRRYCLISGQFEIEDERGMLLFGEGGWRAYGGALGLRVVEE